MKVLNTVSTILLCCSFSLATTLAGGDEQPLLKDYRGDVKIPKELYATYARLVEAFRKGDDEAINKICLPGAVEITRVPRPKETAEYGRDINLPFVRNRFGAKVWEARKVEDGAIILNTGSSSLLFVETEDSGWRLYNYGDSPVQ